MVTSKNNIPKGCLSSFHAKIVTDERKRENTRNLERETTESSEGETQRPLEREVLERETDSAACSLRKRERSEVVFDGF